MYERREWVKIRTFDQDELNKWKANLLRNSFKGLSKRVIENHFDEKGLTDRDFNKLVTIKSRLDKSSLKDTEKYAIKNCDVCRQEILFNFEMMDPDTMDVAFCKKTKFYVCRRCLMSEYPSRPFPKIEGDNTTFCTAPHQITWG